MARPALAMRVIVSKADTPTLMFSDEMTYIVQPALNIPRTSCATRRCRV
jgi:murein L,D-transpeptidase YcbB/YkuD